MCALYNQVYVAAAIVIVVLVMIATDALHRTLVAFVGSFSMLGLLLLCDIVPLFQTVVVWIDEATLALLFGMMIIVGKLSETGAFEVCTKYVSCGGFACGHRTGHTFHVVMP